MWLVTKHEGNEELTGTTSYRQPSQFFLPKISLPGTNILEKLAVVLTSIA
jgi:hypothetical protein